ncbi:MAG: alpha/beta hydrolase [Acidobacteriota bacterium]|nr:alpha/beta hydrolase [Acidobacteriota bacterium]
MLLRLFFIWTALCLRLLGARRVRHRIGDITLLTYEIGRAGREPWVLLHGLGSTSLSWFRLLTALRRRCHLVVPEMSSLGGTQAPCGGLNISEGVSAITWLIENRFPGRSVSLAGISLGGWMATRLALARPDLVDRLVLVSAGGYRDQDWDGIQEMTNVRDYAGVERMYGALFRRTPLAFKWSRKGFLATYNSRAVRHVLETATEEETFDARELSGLEMPVALIWGEHDGLFSPAAARAMEAAIPRAELTVIPDRGHAIHWEAPKELVNAILDFRNNTATATESDRDSIAAA